MLIGFVTLCDSLCLLCSYSRIMCKTIRLYILSVCGVMLLLHTACIEISFRNHAAGMVSNIPFSFPIKLLFYPPLLYSSSTSLCIHPPPHYFLQYQTLHQLSSISPIKNTPSAHPTKNHVQHAHNSLGLPRRRQNPNLSTLPDEHNKNWLRQDHNRGDGPSVRGMQRL